MCHPHLWAFTPVPLERRVQTMSTITTKDGTTIYYKEISAPFYGANRPGSTVSQGVRDMFWLWSMQVGLKAAFDCIKAFSETDFTEDLKRFDIPTLIIHGEDDQFVPISAKIVKNATLKIYPGAPHGLTATHRTSSTKICSPSYNQEVQPDDELATTERRARGEAQAHRAPAQPILDSRTGDRAGAHRDPSRRRVGLAHASG